MNDERSKRASVAIAAGLAILTALLFSGAMRNDFVGYDDPEYVTGNPHVLGGITPANIAWAFTSPAAANWFPITWLSHMLDASLFGTHPAGHHLTSILLHAINAAILFLALAELTGQTWRSAAVAALFAWHPLRVESVAWVAERKDVLSGLFFMLTLWAYARWARSREGRWYVTLLIVFVLGLMSKPMLVTVPFVLLLLDFWPLERTDTRRMILEKLPLLVLSVASCAVTFIVQKQGGAVTEVAGRYSPGNRLENAVVSYARYIGKTVWPTDLAVFYPRPPGWPAWIVIAAIIMLLAIIAIVIAQAKRRRYLFVGWFLFLGMLLPVIGIVQVGQQAMADRYTYLPGIGLAVATVWLVANLNRRMLGVAMVVICVAMAIVTIRQITYWNSTLTLFNRALDVTTDNDLAQGYVGSELSARGDFAGAQEHFREAIRIHPQNVYAQANWGNLLLKTGNPQAAIEHFNEAITQKPNYAPAQNNLGIALIQSGDTVAAEPHFATAVKIKPDWEEARCNWAAALVRLGRMDEGAAQYRIVLQANPENAQAQAGMLRLMGRQ